jgi:hypothetical protein
MARYVTYICSHRVHVSRDYRQAKFSVPSPNCQNLISSNFSKVEGAVLRLLSCAYVDKHMDRAAMYAHGVFSSS